MAKKLKEVLENNQLKMSKEWTINSFWMEDELKNFYNKEKDMRESFLNMKKNPDPNHNQDIII